MTTPYLAPSRAPKQLDIITDTALAREFENHSDLSTSPRSKNHSDLSTVGKKKNHSDLSTSRAKNIAARRKQLGVSTSALISAAGLYPQTYFLAMRGGSNTRGATFMRLEEALDRFAVGYAGKARHTIGEAYLRGLIIDISIRLDLDPEAVLAQDFSSENTNDAIYMRNCHVRRCAIYLMVEGMGFGKAAVARIVGISRQAVHKTGFAIEARRERDASLDEMLGDMMLKVKGRRL